MAVVTAGPPVAERVASPVITRLGERIAASPGDGPALVERFWTDLAHAGGTPLVDAAGDGEVIATFVWRGTRATTRVLFVPNRIGDREQRSASLLQHVPGTDVWHIAYQLRSDHRGSYQFAVDHQPIEDGLSADALQQHLTRLARRGVPDPLCPQTVPTRWRPGSASVFALPDAPSEWWRSGAARVAGRVDTVDWSPTAPVVPRPVHRYRAPGDEAQPLLLLCDGDMWFEHLGLPATLDAAIAVGALPPLTVLAPSAIDLTHRWTDLAPTGGFADALVAALPDLAADLGPIRADRLVVAGQSLGGLTALYAAARHRDLHGVIAQSPSLWWRPGSAHTVPHLEQLEEPWLAEVFENAPASSTTVRIDVGAHEGAMPQAARQLAEVLAARGQPTRLTVYHGGHDYPCWRVALLDGLAALLCT
ncbi:enterochelin esterase domain-containing protein [Flexivirga oryzae]|uniref:Enterochelin esterase family protein n=1 Tax=Flexivirga oryzae TaxID=1794944 RepID=A0A839N7F4_9MICO|nr:enterochelin esterase family protein [Flexivirga oryzae]